MLSTTKFRNFLKKIKTIARNTQNAATEYVFYFGLKCPIFIPEISKYVLYFEYLYYPTLRKVPANMHEEG